MARASRTGDDRSRPPPRGDADLVFEVHDKALVNELSPALMSLLERTALTAQQVKDFRLAVLEMAGNPIEWGRGDGRARWALVTCRVGPQDVTVIVRDGGPGFDHGPVDRMRAGDDGAIIRSARRRIVLAGTWGLFDAEASGADEAGGIAGRHQRRFVRRSVHCGGVGVVACAWELKPPKPVGPWASKATSYPLVAEQKPRFSRGLRLNLGCRIRGRISREGAEAQRREDANGMDRLNELNESVEAIDCFAALREIFLLGATSRGSRAVELNPSEWDSEHHRNTDRALGEARPVIPAKITPAPRMTT
jgi:hypothetical protein